MMKLRNLGLAAGVKIGIIAIVAGLLITQIDVPSKDWNDGGGGITVINNFIMYAILMLGGFAVLAIGLVLILVSVAGWGVAKLFSARDPEFLKTSHIRGGLKVYFGYLIIGVMLITWSLARNVWLYSDLMGVTPIVFDVMALGLYLMLLYALTQEGRSWVRSLHLIFNIVLTLVVTGILMGVHIKWFSIVLIPWTLPVFTLYPADLAPGDWQSIISFISWVYLGLGVSSIGYWLKSEHVKGTYLTGVPKSDTTQNSG